MVYAQLTARLKSTLPAFLRSDRCCGFLKGSLRLVHVPEFKPYQDDEAAHNSRGKVLVATRRKLARLERLRLNANHEG